MLHISLSSSRPPPLYSCFLSHTTFYSEKSAKTDRVYNVCGRHTEGFYLLLILFPSFLKFCFCVCKFTYHSPPFHSILWRCMPLPLYESDPGACSVGTGCRGGAKIPSLSSLASSKLHHDTTRVKSCVTEFAGSCFIILAVLCRNFTIYSVLNTSYVEHQ
jgi:hypothetical protein